MIKLALPSFTVEEAFDKCTQGAQGASLRNEFEKLKPFIVELAGHYKELADAGELHLLKDRLNDQQTEVNAQNLIDSYKNRMRPKGSSGRAIYEQILNQAPFQRCPYCEQNRVKSLDHFLPKAHYPSLSITPNNLVPSCTDCNYAKLDNKPIFAEQVVLHPYFDTLPDGEWLYAQVTANKGVAISFYCSPPSCWDDTLKKRLINHFNVFELQEVYGSYGAQLLVETLNRLSPQYSQNGGEAVKASLEEDIAYAEIINFNSWQSATLRAILNCAQFTLLFSETAI